MNDFMKNRVRQVLDSQKEKLALLKRKVNNQINKLYNEVCKTAFGLDKYRIPIHGIP